MTLASRPLDGPCDDSCGCTTTTDPDDRSTGSAAAIACSLSGTDRDARIEQWQQVLDGVTSRRPVPGGLRLELGDRTRIVELAALVDAEQTCCSFFSFAISVDQRGLGLEVTAPSDGQDLLIALFGS